MRSGGHNYFADGASNVENGITIDLRGLNAIDVHPGSEVASIGPGAKWEEVYAHLEPLGLGVVGGRAGQVGVGGLTLGGGISYFSPRYGWACDSLVEAEIVLVDGTIVVANEENWSDLLAALRGGSAIFGIVTRLDLKLFKQGPIWGGVTYHALETIDEQIKAVSKFSTESFDEHGKYSGYDESASLITSFGFAEGKGSAIVNSIVYTNTSFKDSGDVPEAFQPFFDIPQLFSTVRVQGMTEMAKEQGAFSPNGRRFVRLCGYLSCSNNTKVSSRQWSVVTTHDTSEPMLHATYQRWKTSLPAIENVPGMSWALSLEPLPAAIFAKEATKNAMGLADTKTSLMVTLLSATWDNIEDDTKVEEAAKALFEGIEDDAKRLGAYHPYVYLNYAAPWQDPIASYGPESVRKLQRVIQEVDPAGDFKKLMPGGFKIPG